MRFERERRKRRDADPRQGRMHPSAHARLREEHYPGVRRYVANRLGDGQEAEDLAQQVFEELTRGPTPENPRAYIRAVARNILARHLRRKERELRVLRGLLQLAAPDPLYVEGPSEAEHEDVLKDMAAALSPERMDLLKWRYMQELSIKEIAVRLGCSEPAVHKRLQRIIRFLRCRYQVDE